MSAESKPIRVVVMLRDLIFETKIMSTAKSLGVPAAVVRRVEALSELLGHAEVRLVVVDLGSLEAEALPAIRAAVEHPGRPRVVAFGSHVDTERLIAARAAGADEVWPRSRFNVELVSLLKAQGDAQ